MLDYKLLEALAAVVDSGGFERAARALHLTQSAVSQRVKSLEESSGQVLLVRSSPPRPTDAGLRLLKHFRQVRRLEDDLSTEIHSGKSSFTTLSIGINADSLATWFLPSIRDFLSQYPVLLDLRSEGQGKTHELLHEGKVIGCISSRSEPSQGCRCEFLGSMRYQLMATPSFRDMWFPNGLTLDSIRRSPFLLFSRTDWIHIPLLRHVVGQYPELNPFYVPSASRIVDFICEGVGCGMLAAQQSAPLEAAGQLVSLAEGEGVDVDLFWHHWNIESPLLDAFSLALTSGAEKNLLQQKRVAA